jgi:exosome complex component RRP42
MLAVSELKIILQLLECGGGLIDAISMGVKAALADTKIPKVSVIGSDGGVLELELADEAEGREEPLEWTSAPCLVTLNKVKIMQCDFVSLLAFRSEPKNIFVSLD